MSIHRLAALTGFIALTALAAGCGVKAAKSAGPAATAPAVPVLAADVQRRDIPVELSAVGVVESIHTVTVKPQLEGQLATVHIKDGEDVAQGQLLFTIDPRPFQALLNQTVANLAADRAKAEQADSDNRRYTELIKTGAVAHSEAESKRTTAEALSAQLKADQAAIEAAQLRLAYTTIKSPIAGRAGQVLVDAGNTVKTNDTELVVINQLQPIDVAFSIPESRLAALRRARDAGQQLVATAAPADKSVQPSTGRLTFVDNQVDAQTGTIKLRATFPNEDRRLWPGEFVQVRLTLAIERGALLIPSQAVQTGQQGSFVYIIKPDMTVAARPVTTERYGEEFHIVRDGLTEGERVVSDGQLRLTPGIKVEIKTSLDADSPVAPPPGETKPAPTGAAR